MLSLQDTRWKDFRSGYRVKYDARPLIKRFTSDEDIDNCWEEVWNELHHQGDVDTASYAIFPHLVSIAQSHTRDWNIYSYAAVLRLEAEMSGNPSVPDILEPAYSTAFANTFELAIADLRTGISPLTVRCALHFIAAFANAQELSRAIESIDLFEGFGERVVEAEKRGRN